MNEPAAILASTFINNTRRHIFLTGRAGTGKTTFLRSISSQTHKNTVVAAPTGIAAINAGGVTLHSLFQLPFGSFIPSPKLPDEASSHLQINNPATLIQSLQMHATRRNLLRRLELLIIDEVSMLRADLLDAIDVILRHVRRSRHQPFGGVQILFIGDLYQLPPVVRDEEWGILKNYYPSLFFFEAKALENETPLLLELDKIYRQSDQEFIGILNHFRDEQVTSEDILKLNSRYLPGFDPETSEAYIHLTTHNRKADRINLDRLSRIKGNSFFYQAEIGGEFNETQYPVEARLELKTGAQIMFIKNDYSGAQRYFNGKLARVSALDADEIYVQFEGEPGEILIEHYTWENKKYRLNAENNEIEETVAGTFSQYPIRLAWAITVHKSQGLTFEKAILDLSGVFAPGQMYVALSRLVSLEGMILASPIPMNRPRQDDRLLTFVQSRPAEDQIPAILEAETLKFVREASVEAFNFDPTLKELSYFIRTFNKEESRSAKQGHKSWAIQLEKDFATLAATARSFQQQLRRLLAEPDEQSLDRVLERCHAARSYFESNINDLSKRVFDHLAEVSVIKGTKKYQSELRLVESLLFSNLQAIIKAQALIASVISRQQLSRESFEAGGWLRTRKEQINRAEEQLIRQKHRKKREKNTGKSPSPKEPKPESRSISYQMHKEGKSIQEIAAERGLSQSTIETHLVYYVALGWLPVPELVETGKVNLIKSVVKELESMNVTQIKEAVGNKASYGEIRLCLAWFSFRGLD